MNNSNSPSIFTSKDSLNSRPLPPTAPPLNELHNVRSSSPFRRRNSPLRPRQSASGGSGSATVATSASSSIAKSSESPWAAAATENNATVSIWNSFSEGAGNITLRDGRRYSWSRERFTTPDTEQPTVLHQSPTSGSKRKLSLHLTPAEREPEPTSEPSNKRVKLRPRFKHTLDGSAFQPSIITSPEEPKSPLFFSNSPRIRPQLPRFTSGEAAARATDMLSKARSEESHITTVSLARGTVSTPAAGYAPTSAPVTRKSWDRCLTEPSHSPEAGSHPLQEGHNGMGGVLNSIGIVELLEQDERPTFIVDLGDSSNYGSGPLQPVYTNLSLRSYEGMQALISGISSREPSAGSQMFLQFKAWLLSAAVNGESLNVCLPPFQYASLTWSCSTLRKRLRIISGAFGSPLSASSPSVALGVSVPPSESLPDRSLSEPPDYFGEAAPSKTTNSTSLERASGIEILPTIESRQSDPEILQDAHLTIPAGFDLSAATQLLPSANTYVSSSSSAGTMVPTPGTMSAVSPSTKGHGFVANADPAVSQIPVVSSDSPSFDWTRLPVSDTMPRHIQFARSIDWASTSLGPIEHWCADLRYVLPHVTTSMHLADVFATDKCVTLSWHRHTPPRCTGVMT